MSPIAMSCPHFCYLFLSLAQSPVVHRKPSVRMESLALFEELPFHHWDFHTDYNCLLACCRRSPPPTYIDADGHEWTMYDDGSCWSNFAWSVVVYGTYDAFGKVKMHHVSGDVAMVCDAFSLSPPTRHGSSSLL